MFGLSGAGNLPLSVFSGVALAHIHLVYYLRVMLEDICMFQIVHQVHLFLDWEALLIVTCVLLTSELDYSHTPLNNIQKFQVVQNAEVLV